MKAVHRLAALAAGANLAFGLAAYAGTPPPTSAGVARPYVVAGAENWTLVSRTGGSYQISLAMPSGPAPSSGYPVIYLLDPQWSFATLVETARAREPLTGPVVIVGIGYPDGAPSRRLYDLTIPVDRKTLPNNRFDPPYGEIGGADAFLDFILGEVKRAVAQRVKTDPSRQALFGHSLGGLFVLHALFSRPEAFETYVAASPSIWWGDRAILGEMNRYLARNEPKAVRPRLLITVGSEEQTPTALDDRMAADGVGAADKAIVVEMSRCLTRGMEAVTNARWLAARLAAAPSPAPVTAFAEFAGEDHMSSIPDYLSRALRFATAEVSESRPARDLAAQPVPDLPPGDLQACIRPTEGPHK